MDVEIQQKKLILSAWECQVQEPADFFFIRKEASTGFEADQETSRLESQSKWKFKSIDYVSYNYNLLSLI